MISLLSHSNVIATATRSSWRYLTPTRIMSSNMTTITEGVSFDTVAREWRCKWESEKALSAAQSAINEVLESVKATDGVKEVQRVVCGGCKDFKIITSLPADKFGDWEKAEFAPEKDFLAKLKTIEGIDTVETQTFTLMKM
mmetsp:Transcript_1184/g.1490  ORF Transcript_1184/g.1490 Transcript_1184/m.1490 type:complete len:141 (+) Transcript_1184:102-524(+)